MESQMESDRIYQNHTENVTESRRISADSESRTENWAMADPSVYSEYSCDITRPGKPWSCALHIALGMVSKHQGFSITYHSAFIVTVFAYEFPASCLVFHRWLHVL